MAKYKKRPVVIDAFRCGVDTDEPDWFHDAIASGEASFSTHGDVYIYIFTLEGTMTANVGDWVIKGIQGELYPCKPDIFMATYEAVS